MLPITLRDAMQSFFELNPSVGTGDLRAAVTLEALQRQECVDSWTIQGKKLGRADVMELMIDMIANGFTIPKILKHPGMPRPRTVMGWMDNYKEFRLAVEAAEKWQAMLMTEEAIDILDGSDDPLQTGRDKARADLRMKIAEALNPKKYGKRQQVDVSHSLADVSSEEAWGRFKSILISHQTAIEEQTGVKLVMPIIDAEIVEKEEEKEDPRVAEQRAIGMYGSDDV